MDKGWYLWNLGREGRILVVCQLALPIPMRVIGCGVGLLLVETPERRGKGRGAACVLAWLPNEKQNDGSFVCDESMKAVHKHISRVIRGYLVFCQSLHAALGNALQHFL